MYAAIASIPERRVEIATQHAVVAAAAMPVGTLITAESVKLVDWPARTPLQHGFSSVEDVVDRGLIVPIVENEPLTESKLAPKEAGAGLPPTITPGMRAMSVKVNEVIGVAGFVVPGTRVDVLTIIEGDNRNDTMARVVVSNVQVLSAGTRYDQEEAKQEGKPIRSTVVTLMVTAEDAEKVALAQSQGELMLALRNPLDVEPSATVGVRKATLFGPAPSPAPAARAPRAKPASAPPPPMPPVVPMVRTTYTVETIRAAKRVEEKVLDAVR
ncbi:MAG: Flp pilus assembly protein CpaB [Acidobacteria bacterium RIFCSPLOWO2_12_FULL_67_14]|nr:MAG: Flp pilus assembly protein CpaB [Acidobacteria bacterium RIFCSPLOWO2_12_FULL_67_14]